MHKSKKKTFTYFAAFICILVKYDSLTGLLVRNSANEQVSGFPDAQRKIRLLR